MNVKMTYTKTQLDYAIGTFIGHDTKDSVIDENGSGRINALRMAVEEAFCYSVRHTVLQSLAESVIRSALMDLREHGHFIYDEEIGDDDAWRNYDPIH